jgi:hypothetical protein
MESSQVHDSEKLIFEASRAPSARKVGTTAALLATRKETVTEALNRR